VSSALAWGQRVGRTEKHVYRGLAGLLLVDDQPAAVLDLPRTYGVDDIPVIVQDKRFHDDGSFDESDDRPTGLAGAASAAQRVHRPHLLLRVRGQPLLHADRHRRRAARPTARDRPDPALTRRARRDRRGGLDSSVSSNCAERGR
jgi:FtsP/CotA-like multicopper oxidase with cupredoxin domain